VNEHPEILLAEYADGTLTPDAAAEVEAHLAGCATCREELALAREARAALGILPDVPAPEGLTFAARRRAARPGAPRLTRLVGAAAAAVLVASGVLVVWALVSGQDGTITTAERGGAGQTGAPAMGGAEAAPEAADAQADAGRTSALLRASVPTYSESNRNYDGEDLVKIGRRVRDQARAALEGGLARSATAFYGNFDPASFTPQVREAIECSLAEVPPDQLLVPFSIEAASFEGQPAYVAAFLQGPAPDQPYDRVVVWVVARDTCSLHSLATQRL
jgi:Putative zinc-finger